MEIITILGLYLLVAVGISLTGYFNIHRPSIAIVEEVLEEDTNYNGLLGFLIWNICATVGAPLILLLLLKNDNTGIITEYASAIIDRFQND